MRVTQSMLANHSLQYISQGYERLGRLQDQLVTGKKISRPSQDPVVAMKGMRYRTQVSEVVQFKRNLGEAFNWMDTAESALDQGTEVLKRIRELVQDAANDTKSADERANIAKEIEQLREHLQSIANTKNSNKYIFNGTDTTTPPISDSSKFNLGLDYLFEPGAPLDSVELVYDSKIFIFDNGNSDLDNGILVFQAVGNGNETLTVTNGTELSVTYTKQHTTGDVETKTLRTNDVVVAAKDAVSTNQHPVEIELFKGVTLTVNIDPTRIFNNALFGDIIRLENALKDPDVEGRDLTVYIDTMFAHIDTFVTERAELGARINRAEMMENRLWDLEIIAKKVMSDNEDIDMEEVFINLTIQQSVHRAALAAGARILQPSLMDFLR